MLEKSQTETVAGNVLCYRPTFISSQINIFLAAINANSQRELQYGVNYQDASMA